MNHETELLARSQEEGLDPHESHRLQIHIDACPQCATLADELRRNDVRMSAPEPEAAVRPLEVTRRGQARPVVRGLAGASVFVAGVIAVVVVFAAQLDTQGNPAGASPARVTLPAGDRLVYLDMTTRSFIVVDAGGAEITRIATGGPVAAPRPKIDPSLKRIAFWLGGALNSELVVIDLASRSRRVIATSGDLIPWGELVWTADGTQLVYAVGSPPSQSAPGAAPTRAQLVMADANGAGNRTVRTLANEQPMRPVYADARRIAVLQGTDAATRYMLVDPTNGQTLSESGAMPAAEYGADERSAVLWTLTRQFESSAPQVLRVWRADRYDNVIATLEASGITTPAVDPSRGRLFFSVGTGASELRVLDLARGGTSTILVSAYPVAARAMSSDGATLVIERATQLPRYALMDVRGATGNGSITAIELRSDAPAATLIGVVR